MRMLAIFGLAAILAFQPVAAQPPAGKRMMASSGGRWSTAPRPPRPAWTGGHWNGRGMHRPGWRGHPGFGVHHFRAQRGVFLPPVFISPRFQVHNWYGYGLAEPGYGRYWLRYYDDALLLDGRGYVYDVVPGVRWSDHAPDEEPYHSDWYADDVVTCCGNERLPYAPLLPYGPAYVPVGTTTVIVQQPATVTTTTSYVEEEVVRPAPVKVRKPLTRTSKPRKVWKPAPQCACK